ncbi:hypothetical protein DFJ58DRAFT_843337 [Suillus subalutaceus]|uniref:uncharacterized protein n=1 Tax=Suillus subalutaceus TaxID=48586 RepID=UPI001B878CB6|nr:uncharacterized protein DFJ58DRAFT_843337 [Suillus subalutaceus]KAG1847021.1 hypothetical protein DFJ58DRAFT_843337 [Suillus subalutaceus]
MSCSGLDIAVTPSLAERKRESTVSNPVATRQYNRRHQQNIFRHLILVGIRREVDIRWASGEDQGAAGEDQYINEGRKTRIYAPSMGRTIFVNPGIKLEWLQEWLTFRFLHPFYFSPARLMIWPHEQPPSKCAALIFSATNSAIPPTPTIIVSEPAERFRKELELDRKDAECELSRYEDAGILLKTAERTADIVRFWEVDSTRVI